MGTVIPALVTGIQLPRVGAVSDHNPWKESPAPKDLGARDPCDKHMYRLGVAVR